MKARCSIKGASLKAEIIKEEGGGTHVETFWVVAFKIPADEIDANEINAMIGEQIKLDAETIQTSLDLHDTGKKKRAA